MSPNRFSAGDSINDGFKLEGLKLIGWQVVTDSTRVKAIAYDAELHQIHAEFPDGHHHIYEDCSALDWENFTSSGTSKGQFIRAVLDHHRHHIA